MVVGSPYPVIAKMSELPLEGWAITLLNDATTPPTTPSAPYSPAAGYPNCSNAPGWYRTLLGH
jgi:hypothetical protein